jgi:hypothetical protein
MSKLKHYKGKDWEVKVKYDEEIKGLIFLSNATKIPCISDCPRINDLIDTVINGEYGKYGGGVVFMGVDKYNELINYLDNLTAPKIINEHTFDNPNFKIRIWETEDRIGGETLWVREGFRYYRGGGSVIIENGYKTNFFNSFDNHVYPNFGTSVNLAEIYKIEINYTYKDLYKALERAEQETTAPTKKQLFAGELNELLDKYFGGSNQTKGD